MKRVLLILLCIAAALVLMAGCHRKALQEQESADEGIEVKKILKTVTFSYQPLISGVNRVFLAGTFNDWNANTHEMNDDDGDGIFEVKLQLPVGRYQYKFVVDGQWLTDPNAEVYNDDNRGGKNAVVTVDESYDDVFFRKKDGELTLTNLPLKVDYSMVNPLDENTLEFSTRGYRNDIESVTLIVKTDSGEEQVLMASNGVDNTFEYFRAIHRADAHKPLRFTFFYKDGDAFFYAIPGKFVRQKPDHEEWFLYDPRALPPFYTPEWAKKGIFYQIFPDRFFDGDPSIDPDFSEPWYTGVKSLPASGKTNGEYFHLIKDWKDIAGLTKSPYRTDNRPDYYSFYGGDIAGVMQKLDYLHDLGITIIYFNPLNIAKSNHKYDALDYGRIDPHFADDETFKKFVNKAHSLGIRIIVDMAFNHTGDWHFAFMDTKEKGPDSPYWHWYEWKTWPIPEGPMPEFCDYYSCWWGFSIHPNLDYDLSRPNDQENEIANIKDAEPNWDVVNYVLDASRYWLGELGIDGFRLDVPNEVPLWFWKEFRKAVDEVKPDALLVGEIWGNAMDWLGPHCFHSTMNYKYFKDPVIRFFAQRQIDSGTFDRELAPGRKMYPIQATQVMMNLIGSHDTIRYLNIAEDDERRIMLAALFQMTYVGTPHIYYGDEVALAGGKDPDNRRPFVWDWNRDERRARVHDFYRTMIRIRHSSEALQTGSFTSVYTEKRIFAFLRRKGNEKVLVIINNEMSQETVNIDVADYNLPDLMVDKISAKSVSMQKGKMSITLDGMSGAVLMEK